MRGVVASSLRTGQSEADISEPLPTLNEAAADEADLAYLASLTTDAEPTVRVARRTSALLTALEPSAVPAWAVGMQPTQSFGPFLDAAGRPHWFDLFALQPRFTVQRAGRPLLFLIPGVEPGPPTVRTLFLQPGTVWILATQLASGAPTGSWVGLRIRGGTLTVSEALNFADPNTLQVTAAETVTLEVVLDPPLAPDGSATGPGADAASTTAGMPAAATFVFGPLGVERVDCSAASLSVYGNQFDLSRREQAPRFDGTLQMVLVPMDVTPSALNIRASQSPIYKPSGSAAIEAAAWALVVTISASYDLGTAEGVGYLGIRTAPGLSATWRGLPGEAATLGPTWVAGNPTSLTVVSSRTVHFRGGMTVELWAESADRRSSLDAAFPRPFLARFISLRSGTDSIGVGARVTGHIDRPVIASGARLPLELDGTLTTAQDATHAWLAIDASDQVSAGVPPLALALSNALLTIHRPHRLSVNGTLGPGLLVDQGGLLVEAYPYQLLPTLPDPYAANFEPRQHQDATQRATVAARVSWATIQQPVLDLSLNTPDQFLPDLLPRPGRDHLDPWLNQGRYTGPGAYYWMLDVSTGADQLGVSLSVPPQREHVGSVSIRNLAVQAPGVRVQSFLLPQFQWEPVHNMRNQDTDDTERILESRLDGGPAFVVAETVNLVPVAPIPVATELVRAFTQDRAPARTTFTLPFGIQAVGELQDDGYTFGRPGLQLLATRFNDLTAARQISLTAGSWLVPGGPIAGELITQSLLVGRAEQTRNFDSVQRDNTLGTLIDDFNASFIGEVPIQRIDLSGYGASIFSHWLRSGNPDVGITQVSFEGFSGRTAFERIQMVSYLWPCLARVIRTIVLERQGSGMVRRWDSGWVATTPGRFTHPKFTSIHAGVVDGMYDIRHISDTDDIFDVGSQRVQAVYYDADVAFVRTGANPAVVAGQNAAGRVPARRQLGYIQRVPLPKPPDLPGTSVPRILSTAELHDILWRRGPAGGPVDCVIRVASSDQQMRVTGIYTSTVSPAGPFAVGAYGSPVLPSGGRWSVVKVTAADNFNTVKPADNPLGVPLIRRNGGAYRWAEPIDLERENVNPTADDYAFMLSHDAQRLLFSRLRIGPGQNTLVSQVTPRIADPYRMLQSTGLFPPVSQAIDVGKTVDLTAATLRFATADGLVKFNPPNTVQGLIDVRTWSDAVDYGPADFELDSLRNWQVKINNLEQVFKFDLGGEIFRIRHDAVSEAGLPSAFSTPKIIFPPLLSAVAEILDLLRKVMPDSIQGGVGPLKLACSMEGTTFRLLAVADFAAEDSDGNALDCGMGKLKGHLRVGCELSAELLKRQIHGAVFLEIEGSWQQEVFPGIYGGGLMRFAARGEEGGRTVFDLDACTVGSLGGDLIPRLVELEATVKYGYFIRFDAGTFLPGIVVGMEGRAKLLSGLVGFKLGVEGRMLVTAENAYLLPPRPRDLFNAAVVLRGQIHVAGTVTVAWVVDERKSWDAQMKVRVDWKLIAFAAGTGLLPLP